MDGEEQTAISPEFLENIQSAVNSQGVLGQVQVIETENGPVTVLFMEEGADASNIGDENVTLTVTDGNLGDVGADGQNSQVQFQYQVQTDEDYTQFLQSDNTDTVSTPETVKEDVVATVEPVIGLPEQETVENLEQNVGESTDTYFITDTGEILKIDSSLLGDNSDATLQLQTQDGSYQVLNQLGSIQTTQLGNVQTTQLGNVQTTQVDAKQSFSQPTVENMNITYEESVPFEFTATKVDSPLVIDTKRVEEPKVLSYKTTNRQRTNIMRQPVSKSSAVNIQSKPVVTNQNVKTQTSLLTQAHYKTVKQTDLSGNTTEVVYPKPYQKQTIVFPKVQKQSQFSNVIKTGQQSFQPKVKAVSQQMITTVMKPQSLIKPSIDQSFSASPVVNKLSAAQIPGGNTTTQSTYNIKKPVSEQNKLLSQVISRQVPAVTKQQTDLLSVAMKQAEVPEQILSSIPAVQKKISATTLVKQTVPVLPQAGRSPTELLGVKEGTQEFVVEKPVDEVKQTSLSTASELPVTEKQSAASAAEQQATHLSTAEQLTELAELVMKQTPSAVENADAQNDEVMASEMETSVEQPIEDEQPKVHQKADVPATEETELPEPDTAAKQVVITSEHEMEKQISFDLSNNETDPGEIGELQIFKWDENMDMVEVKVRRSNEIYLVDNENDANKISVINSSDKNDSSKETKSKCSEVTETVQKSANKLSAKVEGIKFKSVAKDMVIEKVVFSKKIGSRHVKRLLKCGKCLFTTSKKSKLEQHMKEHNKKNFRPKQYIPENTVKCRICSLVMLKEVYTSHVVEMHQPRRYECKKCQEIFWNEESLRLHVGESVCEPVYKGDENITNLRTENKSTNKRMAKDHTLEKLQVERVYESHKNNERTVGTQTLYSSDYNLNKNTVDTSKEIQISDKAVEKLPVKHKLKKNHDIHKSTVRKDMHDENTETGKSRPKSPLSVEKKLETVSENLIEQKLISCSIEDEIIVNSPSYTYEITDSSSEAETIEISDSDSLPDKNESVVCVSDNGTDLSDTYGHYDEYSSFKIINNENQEVIEFFPQPSVVLERVDLCESAVSKSVKGLNICERKSSSKKSGANYEGANYGINLNRKHRTSNWPLKVLEETESDDDSEDSDSDKSYKPENEKYLQVNLPSAQSKLGVSSVNDRIERSCIFCAKRIVGRRRLKSHLRQVHTGPFKCSNCKSTFRKKPAYRAHMKTPCGRSNYRCSACGKTFDTQRQKDFHNQREHNRNDYVCEVCGQKLFSKYKYLRHLKGHQGLGKFKCPQCDFGFDKKEHLEKHKINCGTEAEVKHLANITRNAEKNAGKYMNVIRPHRCNICSKSFVTIKSLKVHKKSVHKTVVKSSNYSVLTVSDLSAEEKKALSFKRNRFWSVNFPTEQAKESEIDQEDFTEILQHVVDQNINIDDLKRVFQCDFCKQCFRNRFRVTAHVRSHKTVCSICDRILHDYTSLRRHRIFAHAESRSENIPCEKCSKVFCTQSDLLYHMKVHIGPWICEFEKCRAKFSEKKDLVRHKRTHAKGKFVCVCDRRFKRKKSLMKHIKEKRGNCQPPEWPDGRILCINENVIDKMEPLLDIPASAVASYIEKGEDIVIEGRGTVKAPYMCKVCSAQFISPGLTKKHILLRHCKNTKERPFICNVCGFSTHRSDILKTHQKTHERTFKCEFCPSSFEEMERLQKHILYHFKDKYQCFYCSKMYVSRYACREHILTSHAEEREKYKNLPFTEKSKWLDADITNAGHENLEKPGSSESVTELGDKSGLENFETQTDPIKNEKGLGITEKYQKNNADIESRDTENQSETELDGADVDYDVDEDNTEVQKCSSEDLLETNLTKELENNNEANNFTVLSPKAQNTSVSNTEEMYFFSESAKHPVASEEKIVTTLTVEHMDTQKELTLNEINLEPMDTAITPSQQLQQSSLETAYDNLVDHIGTILTQEVWNTANIDEDASSSLIPERTNIPDFDEYRGRIPEGLELYIPTVGPYKCKGCGTLCDGQDNFKNHVQTLHTEGLRCKICNKKSTTQIILVNHMIHKHLEGNPLKCPECKMGFRKINAYWRHAEMHVKCFMCEVCQRPFRRKMDLADHLHMHVERKELCIRCGERFDTADMLRMHTFKAHNIILHKNKNRRKGPKVITHLRKWIPKKRRDKKLHTINELVEKNTETLVEDADNVPVKEKKAAEVAESTGELAKGPKTSQTGGEMKSIDVPDSDVTIQLFADGTLVTRDKAGTNYSQVKLEDLGLDLSMLEGNTDIELLIVQGDGKEVRATINTSKDVNPTTESVTQVTKSDSSTVVASNAGENSKETAISQPSTVLVNEARPYKCSMCPRTFKFYRTFRCHEIVHTKAVTFTCHLCQRLFAREVNLQSHLELHKKKGAMKPTEEIKDAKSRQCQQCKKIFADTYKLDRHIRELHEQKKVPCPICGKLFKNETNVHRHAKIHVGPFTCPHCVKVFMERLEYYDHIKSEHADLMYCCKDCDAILPSKKAFVSHTLTQHSNAEKLLEGIKDKECTVCNKKFDKQSMLESHMVVHSHEKCHVCPSCFKKYKHLNRLEQHIREEHNNDVVFTCSECEEQFHFKGKLDLHVKLFHTGTYRCLTCYEEFPERLQLEEHQFSNHDIRFACSKCEEKFETSLRLKHHLKKHSSQNNLCDICGKGFEHKPQLRTHLTDQHFAKDKAEMLKQYPGMAKVNFEIVCDLCGEFWPNKPAYKQHLRDVHFGGDTVAMLQLFPYFEKIPDPPEPATCDHCGKVFSNVAQLNLHLKSHMRSKEKIKLKEEFISTDDEDDDEVDLSNIEPRETDKSYRCLQCGADFSRKASLDKHMSVHQKDEFKEALREIEKEEKARAELEQREGWKPSPKTKKTATVSSVKKTKVTKLNAKTLISTKTVSSEKKPKVTKPTNTTPNSAKVKLPLPKAPAKKTIDTAETDLSQKRRSSQIHICKICEEIFKSSQELTVHLQDDHGDVDFKAETDVTADITESLKGTADTDKPTVEFDLTTFKCFSCNKDFKCRKYLRKHLNRVHKYKHDPFIEGSTVNTGRQSFAKSEIQQQLNDTKSPVKSPTKKSQKKEQESDDDYEPMEENTYNSTEDSAADITAFLGKNFNLGKAHSCNIESVKMKQHRCNLCGQGFSREATLKKHLALHQAGQGFDIKPDIDDISDLQPAIYPCSSCGNMYSTALGLIHHNRSKHSDVDEEVVLGQIAEVDEKFKLESPKKKNEKEPSKALKRKLDTDADEIRENAKKRLKLDKDGKEAFGCKFCGAVYYTFKGLMKHEHEMHNEQKVESPHSPLKYSHSGRLITKSKKLSEQIQCDKCSKTFLEEKNLKLHILKVHKVEDFEKSKPAENIHVIAPKSAPVTRFKCDHCSKEFDLRINLRRHMKMKHNIELPPETANTSAIDSPVMGKVLVYHCDVCEQKFSTLSSLQHHLISVHDENDENLTGIKTEPVTCQICEQDFATEKTLEVHMRKHTGEKPYKCCLCNKQFISKYQLECHMKKLHTKLWAKKIKCKICLMLFETEKAMMKHKVIHRKPVSNEEMDQKNRSEPRQHKCNHCMKAFKWKRNLKSHVETYHKDSDPQTCGLCNKVFPDMASVKAHMAEHQNATSYQCKLCEKSFPKETSLKMHESHVHKPKSSPSGSGMSCDICKESFQTKMKLLEHMLTHTSVMPHKCDMCSASFKQEFKLKAHKLNHKLKNKKTEKMKETEKGQISKGKESAKDGKKEVSRIKFKCKKCSKQFSKLWLLKRHVTTTHKPKLPVNVAFMKSKRVTRSRSSSESITGPVKKETSLKEKTKLKDKKNVSKDLMKEKKNVSKDLMKEKKNVSKDLIKEKKNVAKDFLKKKGNVAKDLIKEKKPASKDLKKVDKSTGFCKKCNLNFIKIETYDKHMKIVHQKSKKGESPKLSKEEMSKKLKKEILPKSSVKTIKTKTENKSAKKNKKGLVEEKKDTIGHDCPICKKMFSKQFKLKNHIKNVHKFQVEESPSNIEMKRKRCLYCTECARVFWSQMQYDSHNKRFHPDKGALELDKQVMQAMSGEIKTEPEDSFSPPKQTDFETVQHKCEFCSKVHWTKKLFDEHMLKEHPEHAHEYGISITEDMSRPTIEFVNDSEDMMGNLLSVGLYDVSACDKLSSLPVVSIQRINGKLGSLISGSNQQLTEMQAGVELDEQNLNEEVEDNENTDVGMEELVDKTGIEPENSDVAGKTNSSGESCDVGCIISSVKTLQGKETEDTEEEMIRRGDADLEKRNISEDLAVPEMPSDAVDRNSNDKKQGQYSTEYEKFLQNTQVREHDEGNDEEGSFMEVEQDLVAETATNTQIKDSSSQKAFGNTFKSKSIEEQGKGEDKYVEEGSCMEEDEDLLAETEVNAQIENSDSETAFGKTTESDKDSLSEDVTKEDMVDNTTYRAEKNVENGAAMNKGSVIPTSNDTQVNVSKTSKEEDSGPEVQHHVTVKDFSINSDTEIENENTEESENEKEQEGIDWEAIDNEIEAVVEDGNLESGNEEVGEEIDINTKAEAQELNKDEENEIGGMFESGLEVVVELASVKNDHGEVEKERDINTEAHETENDEESVENELEGMMESGLEPVVEGESEQSDHQVVEEESHIHTEAEAPETESEENVENEMEHVIESGDGYIESSVEVEYSTENEHIEETVVQDSKIHVDPIDELSLSYVAKETESVVEDTYVDNSETYTSAESSDIAGNYHVSVDAQVEKDDSNNMSLAEKQHEESSDMKESDENQTEIEEMDTS